MGWDTLLFDQHLWTSGIHRWAGVQDPVPCRRRQHRPTGPMEPERGTEPRSQRWGKGRTTDRQGQQMALDDLSKLLENYVLKWTIIEFIKLITYCTSNFSFPSTSSTTTSVLGSTHMWRWSFTSPEVCQLAAFKYVTCNKSLQNLWFCFQTLFLLPSEAKPEKFNSRLRNKMFYAGVSVSVCLIHGCFVFTHCVV